MFCHLLLQLHHGTASKDAGSRVPPVANCKTTADSTSLELLKGTSLRASSSAAAYSVPQRAAHTPALTSAARRCTLLSASLLRAGQSAPLRVTGRSFDDWFAEWRVADVSTVPARSASEGMLYPLWRRYLRRRTLRQPAMVRIKVFE